MWSGLTNKCGVFYKYDESDGGLIMKKKSVYRISFTYQSDFGSFAVGTLDYTLLDGEKMTKENIDRITPILSEYMGNTMNGGKVDGFTILGWSLYD